MIMGARRRGSNPRPPIYGEITASNKFSSKYTYLSNFTSFFLSLHFTTSRTLLTAEVTGIDMGSTLRAYDCSSMTTGLKSQGMVLRVCIEPMPSAILDGFR